jgi:hypothetical protein
VTNQPEADPYLLFFRPGELLLNLEPAGIDVPAGRQHLQFEDVRAFHVELERSGIALHPTSRSWVGLPDHHRPLITRRRRRDQNGAETDSIEILHRVRLAEWISEEERVALEAREERAPARRAIAAVRQAVGVLNTGGLTAGGFRVRAASPNWLAFPLNGW